MPKQSSDYTPSILHVLPTFGVGGIQVRLATTIDKLGDRYRHLILALDNNHRCQTRISNKMSFQLVRDHENTRNVALHVARAVRYLKRHTPDLLITYNWGTIDWAMASALVRRCPHIHFEDGFGIEEADRQLVRRALTRAVVLRMADRIVVPSKTLSTLATKVWKLKPEQVTYIPNGVNVADYAETAAAVGTCRSNGQGPLIVGTIAPLRPEKNIELLLATFAELNHAQDIRLYIVGDGTERQRLEAHANSLNVCDHTVFHGLVDDIRQVLADFDVFALTSRTEQMPISILQAMAAAKPIVALDTGDIKEMVSPENIEYITPKGDQRSLVAALSALLQDADARRRIGAANRARVHDNYPEHQMVQAYRKLFDGLLGRATE